MFKKIIKATTFNPLVAFLIIGVISPAIGVLWFMFSSIESERLAATKKLEIVFERQVKNAIFEFEKHWSDQLHLLDKEVTNTPLKKYPTLIKSPSVSTVVFWKDDSPLYPAQAHLSSYSYKKNSLWKQSQKYEFIEKSYLKSQKLYQKISTDEAGIEQKLAKISEARILQKLQKHESAIEVLETVYAQGNQHKNAFQTQIMADAALRTLQLLNTYQHPQQKSKREKAIHFLTQKLSQYGQFELQHTQRRYLIAELKKIDIHAEHYIPEHIYKSETVLSEFDNIKNRQELNQLKHLIPVNSKTKTYTLLLDKSVLENNLKDSITHRSEKHDITLKFINTFQKENTSESFTLFSESLGAPFEGYTVHINSPVNHLTSAESRQKYVSYLAMGIITLIILIISSSFVALKLRKQEKLNRLKSDVMTTVSHELRTPLSSVRILVDNLIDDESIKGTKIGEYVRIISDENERLTRLVNNFLEFSRIDKKKHNFNDRHTTINMLINRSIKDIKYYFERENVSITSPNIEQDLHVYGDIEKLTIVLTNLLENALKYSNTPKEISIKVYSNAQHHCISVIDNGIGIAGSEHKKIFDQFYRVDQNLHRNSEGCGLGLYISAYILKKHNGKLTVESELGKGSVFTLHLPKTDQNN